jgi:hypothetical protein
MLSCKLLSTTAAFVLYILSCLSPIPSHVRILYRTSVVLRADRCHCQAAEFMLHIYLKIKFKALHTLLNSAEYTITRKRVFLFPCLKFLLGLSNRWTLCHPHQPSCGVCSSWEGREILAISALPFSTLCDKPPLLPSRAISRTRSNPALLQDVPQNSATQPRWRKTHPAI